MFIYNTYKQKMQLLPLSQFPRQGSNLNSSEPKSDVFPITPQGIKGVKMTYVSFRTESHN